MSDSEVNSDIENATEATMNTFIPDKSKSAYEATYKKFETWCQQRNVVSVSEKSKEMILATNKFEDDVLVYVMASLLSVLATAITSLPIDIIKTRVQNMKTVNGVPEHTGAIDAFGKLIRKEGILSLWKGILPFLARSGPHGIITFVVFEKLQNTYRNFYM